MNVQLVRKGGESPKASRTRSLRRETNPSSRMINAPGLALSANPERKSNPMMISGMTVVNNWTDNDDGLGPAVDLGETSYDACSQALLAGRRERL